MQGAQSTLSGAMTVWIRVPGYAGMRTSILREHVCSSGVPGATRNLSVFNVITSNFSWHGYFGSAVFKSPDTISKDASLSVAVSTPGTFVVSPARGVAL